MNRSPNEIDVPLGLVEKWELEIGDEDTAFGEVEEFPAALSVLGPDPLALMMVCKIRSSPAEHGFSIPHEIAVLINQKRASITLEDGYAWLSFYDLSGKSLEEVRGLFEQFARALKEQNLATGPGCTICGSLEGAELVFSGGKCSRVCEPCLAARLEEQEQKENERKRPSTFHSYALPWAVGLAGVGWMAFWVLIDLVLDYLNTNTIAVPSFVSVLVLLGLGMLLGAPVGLVLRKSGLGRRSPALASIIAVALAALLGEAFYISAYLYRHFGFLDLAAGFQVLVPFFSSYDSSWIAAKLFVAIAIGAGCFAAANEDQQTAGLPI